MRTPRTTEAVGTKVLVVRMVIDASIWEKVKRAGYKDAEVRQMISEEGLLQVESMADVKNGEEYEQGHGCLK